nr:hypothetical protein Iba_chr15eCG7940 [Ipomoea batatas]
MNIEPPAQKSLNITPQHVDTESLVEVGTRQLQEESGSTDGHIQEENPTPQTSNDQSSEPLSNQEESSSTDGHIQEENPTPQTSNDQSSEPLSNPPRRHRAVPPLLEAESKNFIELLRTQRLAILLLICEYGSNPESSQNHMPVVLCMLQFMVSERCRAEVLPLEHLVPIPSMGMEKTTMVFQGEEGIKIWKANVDPM